MLTVTTPWDLTNVLVKTDFKETVQTVLRVSICHSFHVWLLVFIYLFFYLLCKIKNFGFCGVVSVGGGGWCVIRKFDLSTDLMI